VVYRRSILRPPSTTFAVVSIVVSEAAFVMFSSPRNAFKW
jgi:hypothetical protein